MEGCLILILIIFILFIAGLVYLFGWGFVFLLTIFLFCALIFWIIDKLIEIFKRIFRI